MLLHATMNLFFVNIILLQVGVAPLCSWSRRMLHFGSKNKADAAICWNEVGIGWGSYCKMPTLANILQITKILQSSQYEVGETDLKN